jgi:long-subunit fatty acid transport protein
MGLANSVPRGSANGFRLVICWAAAALVVLSPYAALAEIGPALTGLTGRANDATSVFFSPAGITRLDRPEVVAQATLMYQESRFDVQQATYSGGDSDKDNRIFVIPAAYYGHPISERWRLGLSVNVPSGIGHDYGRDWSGRYLSEESDLAFVAASSVLVYRFNDRLSLGSANTTVTRKTTRPSPSSSGRIFSAPGSCWTRTSSMASTPSTISPSRSTSTANSS